MGPGHEKLSSKSWVNKAALFDYYSKWFSPQILAGLIECEHRSVRFHQMHGDPAGEQIKLKAQGVQLDPLPFYPQAAWIINSSAVDKLDPHSSAYYLQDPASLLPVLALQAQPGERVLDLCAAPGGKSLFLADLMNYQGTLWANEISAARFLRLKHNFQRFKVPWEQEQWELKLLHQTPRDIAAEHPHSFDKVLLDVPCSMEAHVLQNSEELKKWSPSRSHLLAKRQRKIFKAGLACAKPGGTIVYSTCSISPLENEENIEFLLSKFKDQIVIDESCPLNIGWKRKYGYLVLPSEHHMGPMYYCVLTKL